ncbi:hypothetical protein [Acidisphaera sp. L21]|uniref:hypothetical protein n=1 Tax=Acidisphaera sp. L21 TaxID=1641851 RepID=UPI00131A9795|nr:hypothetical protein [Acidisphaera sp. L21]
MAHVFLDGEFVRVAAARRLDELKAQGLAVSHDDATDCTSLDELDQIQAIIAAAAWARFSPWASGQVALTELEASMLGHRPG